MFTNKFHTLAIALSLSLFHIGVSYGDEKKTDSKDYLSLNSYLFQTGNKLDCYFTIENDHIFANSGNFLTQVKIADKSVGSIAELVRFLTTQMPDADISQDEKIPVVVRIKAKSLLRVEDYILQKQVTLDFNDPVGLIFRDLSRQGIRTLKFQAINTGGSFADFRTKVNFSAKNEQLRQTLTRYLPLSLYRKVLWTAQTVNYMGEQQTQLLQNGPIPSFKHLVYGVKESQLPFSQGIYAYAKNPNTDQFVSDALSFIEERMKTTDKLNVRWAMFYLGKHKVEKGIPILLKYVDYQYTTSPLMDEAFPALKALVQIGKPASDAALKSLSTEKDPKRLRLLIRVVMGVNGLEEGSKIVSDALPNIKDAAQRKQVETALKIVAAQIPNDATATVPEPDDEQEVDYTPPA